ncbi:MAG: hypothetical protein AB7G28_21095 [Pirellulales bacterium]
MDAPAFHIYRGDTATAQHLPLRGIGWVLRWAAAMAVFGFTLLVLAAFAFQLSAEQALRTAARAGLREAGLPRSTRESVAAVIRQHLAARPRLMRATQLQLHVNGSPVVGPVAHDTDKRLSLSLSAPASLAVPRWLSLFSGDSTIRAQADQPQSPR